MRLFLDGRWLSTPQQGVVTYLVGLVEAILAAKARGEAGDIELVVGVESDAVIPANLLAADLQFLVLGKRRKLWRQFVLPFVLAKHNIDIAHFQYVCPYIRLHARYVTSIHDVLFLSYPQMFNRKYRLTRGPTFWLAARLSDLVLALSDASFCDIRECLGFKGWLEIVPVGSDVSIRKSEMPLNNPAVVSRKFILTVGRVEPRKNYVRLASSYAATDLHAAGVNLVIVGWAAKEFVSEAEVFSRHPGVVWLQHVDDGELNWLYRNAAGFVFPSICEGYGIPLVEALQSGLACATSNTYPIEDIKNVCDARFDPYDEQQIAAALLKLMAAETEGKSTSPGRDGSVQAVLNQYSWDRACEKYLSLIRQLAEKMRGR